MINICKYYLVGSLTVALGGSLAIYNYYQTPAPAPVSNATSTASKPASSPASRPVLKEMPKVNVLGTETSPPTRIKVAHILVSFAGARTAATRTKAEAEKLALEIFQKLQSGADFDALMKGSDDPGGGKYGMFTDPKAAKPGDLPRTGMVGAFGDVGFTLKLNEFGLAVHELKASPFGWHIIKRIE